MSFDETNLEQYQIGNKENIKTDNLNSDDKNDGYIDIEPQAEKLSLDQPKIDENKIEKIENETTKYNFLSL